MLDQIETFGMLLVKGVAAPALTALLAWATVQLGGWIKTKSRNEKIAGMLDRLRELTFHVIQEVQQTIVSALPDKADKGALLAARNTALSTLKSHLGENGLRELMTVFGLKDDDAVVNMLLSYIESAVMTMKASNGPITTTVLKNMGPFDEKTTTVVQPGTPPVVVIPAITQGTAP